MTITQYNFYPVLTPVRVVQTANLAGTYSNGPLNNGVGSFLLGAATTLTIDAVLVENGDRVLLVGQTAANENGIYVVSGIGSAWKLTRSDDFNDIENLKPGLQVGVGAGTTNGGAHYTVVEPLPAIFGVSDIVMESSEFPGGGAQTFSDVTVTSTLTVPNDGLHILDTNASHDLIVEAGSNLTADRTLTVTTGDADRTLDISAASVTISAFGATLVDDATNLAAMTTLDLKRGDSNTWGGGGTSFAFTCAGIVATDVVLVSLIASANNVAVTKCVAGAGTITVDFTADPGAGTIVNFLGIPTV